MNETELIIKTLSSSLQPLGQINAFDETFDVNYKLEPYFTEKGKLSFDVILWTDDEWPEPYAKISSRNPPYEDKLSNLEFFVKDWSENASWIDQILKFPEFEDTGKVIGGDDIWKLVPVYLNP